MNKLRVAFFIDAVNAGAGTENQVLVTLARLDPNRFETRLVTLREPVPPDIAARLPGRCECLHLRRLQSLQALGVFGRLVRTLRRERIDIAMIYFVDSQLFVPPAAFLTGRTICVVNRRDMGYWYTPKLLRLLRPVNKLVDYFLVNAVAVKKLVEREERFPGSRIKVLYNMLTVKPTADLAPLARHQLGVPETAPLVVLVANLRPVKRVDRFIQLAALVAERREDTHFLILGSGELRDQLLGQATELGLTDQVVFAGSVANVGPYLQLCDVGVLTSASEGLSNTLIEYSYHRLPVVAFDTGGNAEVIENGVTGYLINENDLQAMATKVVELLNDRDLRQHLGQAGRQRVEELFSPDKRLAELEDFLTTIARAGRRKARF